MNTFKGILLALFMGTTAACFAQHNNDNAHNASDYEAAKTADEEKAKEQKEIIEIIRRCVDLGVGLNIQNRPDTNTMLHEVVQHEYLAAAMLLLKNGANPNIQGVNGLTPLHMAYKQGDEAMTELLLQAGADRTILNNWHADYRGNIPLSRQLVMTEGLPSALFKTTGVLIQIALGILVLSMISS